MDKIRHINLKKRNSLNFVRDKKRDCLMVGQSLFCMVLGSIRNGNSFSRCCSRCLPPFDASVSPRNR